MKKFIPIYDLSSMTEEQKRDYILAVCEHLDVPPELNLVRLIWSDEGDGARRQVAYVLKGGTDIIREKKKITTESLTSIIANGAILFTATGKDSTGRQEIAVGSSHIDGLKGRTLDNGIMTAQTRATRRMTLQFVGGGVLDESEVNTATTNIATQATPLSQLALAPQPTVKPNDAAGKDITEKQRAEQEIVNAKIDGREPIAVFGSTTHLAPPDRTKGFTPVVKPPLSTEALQKGAEALQQAFVTAVDLVAAQHPEAGKAVEVAQQLQTATEETPEQFSVRMNKLRADAIAHLNAKETSVQPPKNVGEAGETSAEPKKRRGRKSKGVDLSSPGQVADIKSDTVPVPAAVTLVPAVVSEQPKADIKAVTVPTVPVSAPEPPTAAPGAVSSPVKPRLTQEQVKPFRQRLFKLVNDYLEPAGFVPREGMGNADKMRNLAGIMFPSVQNMNELTIEQWEKYLGSLEIKVQKEGAVATVKYIEESIGI